jgi:pilus assembly protein CpaE
MRVNKLTESEAARPRAGLFIADERLIDQTRSLLETGGMTVAAAMAGQDGWERLSSGELSSLEAVVFDLRDQPDLQPKARELLEGCRPGAAVVILGRDDDLGLYRSLKAIGVSDYFGSQVQPDELADSMLALLGLSGPKRRVGGRLVAVHGVRGGLGSGLIAAGLGAVLSEEYGRDTAVVDACLGFPAAESYLGVNSPGNLGVLLEAEDRLDRVLLEQAILNPMDRLTLLSGQIYPDETVRLAPETFRRLADLLAERNRCQIWRSQPGGPMEAQLLAEAHQIILLTGGSVPAARATQSALRWIREHNRQARIATVYNQVTPDPAFPPAQLAKSLGIEFQLVIPYVKGLAEDLVNEVPLSRRQHAFSKPLTALAKLVMGQPGRVSGGAWERLRRMFQ